MSDLKEQVFIVTGSATGVGAACVRRLSRDGARVVINYSRSETEARATEAESSHASYVAVRIAKVGARLGLRCVEQPLVQAS